MKKLDIYCIGLGKDQFENHLSKTLITLKDILVIKKLCDLDKDRCLMFRQIFMENMVNISENSIETDVNLMLGSLIFLSKAEKDKSVFIISTPPETHFRLAKLCLNLGVHIYIDKPFTLNYKSGKKIIELNKEKKRVIVIGSQRKFESIYLKMIEEIKKLDRVYRIHMHSHGNFRIVDPFFRESNVIPIGMGYHLVDTLIWIISSIGENVDKLKVLSSITKAWEENPKSIIAFDAQLIYKGKNMKFPITISCSHLSPKNSVDELLIVSGHKCHKKQIAEREVQYRRKFSPRSSMPGKAEVIFWDLEEKKVKNTILNDKTDAAERGAPLKQMLENIYSENISAIRSTGREALPVLKILDKIIIDSIKN